MGTTKKESASKIMQEVSEKDGKKVFVPFFSCLFTFIEREAKINKNI